MRLCGWEYDKIFALEELKVQQGVNAFVFIFKVRSGLFELNPVKPIQNYMNLGWQVKYWTLF